jgi:hypothetical protein
MVTRFSGRRTSCGACPAASWHITCTPSCRKIRLVLTSMAQQTWCGVQHQYTGSTAIAPTSTFYPLVLQGCPSEDDIDKVADQMEVIQTKLSNRSSPFTTKAGTPMVLVCMRCSCQRRTAPDPISTQKHSRTVSGASGSQTVPRQDLAVSDTQAQYSVCPSSNSGKMRLFFLGPGCTSCSKHQRTSKGPNRACTVTRLACH